MQEKIFISILVILATVTTSCNKDWLNLKPDDNLTTPSTLQDFQALMDNDIGIFNFYGPSLGVLASDGHYIDDNVYNFLSDNEKNAYEWSHRLPYLNVGDWTYNYKIIFYCNVVLDGLNGYKLGFDEDELTLRDIKGQALFQRARVFFDLSQLFAPQYNSTTASTDLGIPIRLESDVDIPVKRSTVLETYNQIISDLILAKDLLPNSPMVITRASKPAVFALLSRVMLTKGDYSSAKMYADSCLNIKDDLIDFNTLSTSGSSIGLPNPEIIFQNELFYYNGLRQNNLRIDTALYNSYDTNDLRKEIFFIMNSDGSISFKGYYDHQNIQLWGGLATNEVYLTRAECNARQGNIIAAMNDLNTIMRNRWKNTEPFSTFSATNTNEAIAKILSERNKELVLRGLRWSDLRRLNTESEFSTTLVRKINGETNTLHPNSYKYTFPIPDDIIQVAGLKQNNGW